MIKIYWLRKFYLASPWLNKDEIDANLILSSLKQSSTDASGGGISYKFTNLKVNAGISKIEIKITKLYLETAKLVQFGWVGFVMFTPLDM